MNNYLFIAKTQKDVKGNATDDIIKLFTSQDATLDQIKQAVENANERLYVSWATVDARDKDGEKIPIDQAIQQQDILMQRNAPIMDMHSNRHVGETLAYRVMEHPKTKTTAILHLDRIFNHNTQDDLVWEEIQSGKRTGSSVGGFNLSEKKELDQKTGRITTVLEGFNQYETSTVFRPANPYALNEAVSAVAKSEKAFVKADVSIPASELNRGIQVEMEHTQDPNEARHIAMDHLIEDPAYYSKLQTVESEPMAETQKTEGFSSSDSDKEKKGAAQALTSEANVTPKAGANKYPDKGDAQALGPNATDGVAEDGGVKKQGDVSAMTQAPDPSPAEKAMRASGPIQVTAQELFGKPFEQLSPDEQKEVLQAQHAVGKALDEFKKSLSSNAVSVNKETQQKTETGATPMADEQTKPAAEEKPSAESRLENLEKNLATLTKAFSDFQTSLTKTEAAKAESNPAPKNEDSNEQNVFKAGVQKAAAPVAKASTPRPGSPAEVKKTAGVDALALATGKTKLTLNQIHKAQREVEAETYSSGFFSI